MQRLFNKTVFFLLLGLIFQNVKTLEAQNVSHFQYLNPLPNSLYVSVNSNIIVRQGDLIDRASIKNNIIEVSGTKSGTHTGRIILARDGRTLLFTSYIPFEQDEEVNVKLKDGLKTENGVNIGVLQFNFHTCKNTNTFSVNDETYGYKNTVNKSESYSVSFSDTALPSDLPEVIISTSNNPSPGYFFMPTSPYLQIVDNEGTPVFYRKVGGSIYDFDLQADGELTYFIYPISCYGLNSSLDSVRTFNTDSGYTVNVHDLRVLPDGSYYIFGNRIVDMDMSKIVAGGNTNAKIHDNALQEFDADNNLIFEWDALAHYKITDADSKISLTQPAIDFPHFNSVEIDSDGNLLISARNLDEITKVDHNTGDIIWRLGGENNQFTFINDDLRFSRQHDIRRLSNGNISLFDNGVYHSTPVSSAVEYKLDEVNKTATLIRRIYHKNIYTSTEGSMQEMQNGNWVISWGHNWNPVVTEVKPNDSVAIDLSYQKPIDTYRAFKYQWKTDLFTTNVDSLNFGKVAIGDSLQKQFTVYNPHNTDVIINEFFCRDSSFSTTLEVPDTIKANDSLVVPIMFKPLRNDTIEVSFNIRNIGRNGYEQMIARQVILTGETDNATAIKSDVTTPLQFILFQNYPNPFNPSTIINYEIPKSSFVTLKAYDMLGREVATLVNEEKPAGRYNVTFDASKYSSGVYFYRITAGGFSQIKKMVLLK